MSSMSHEIEAAKDAADELDHQFDHLIPSTIRRLMDFARWIAEAECPLCAFHDDDVCPVRRHAGEIGFCGCFERTKA